MQSIYGPFMSPGGPAIDGDPIDGWFWVELYGIDGWVIFGLYGIFGWYIDGWDIDGWDIDGAGAGGGPNDGKNISEQESILAK